MTIRFDASISTDSAAAGWREQPAFFPGEDGSTLLGIFGTPTTEPLGVAAFVLSAGGFIGSTHRNRLNVRICSELAAAGFHTMRFDWHGVGDSTGTVDRFDLDRPFVQDVLGAARWVLDQGIDRFVVIGSCFGARTALAGASSIEGLEALFLVSLPLRTRGRSTPRRDRGQRIAEERSMFEVLRKGLRPSAISALRHPRRRRVAWRFAEAKARSIFRQRERGVRPTAGEQTTGGQDLSWVSADVVAWLEHAARHSRIHLVYGAEDHGYREFLETQSGPLAKALASGRIEVEVLPGEVHGFQHVDAQEAVLESVRGWAATAADLISHPGLHST